MNVPFIWSCPLYVGPMAPDSETTMPARNIHHAVVVRALTADGWTITHDPYPLSFGGKDLFVDLGAEEAALAAEKEGRRIAVEIQSFLGRPPGAQPRRGSRAIRDLPPTACRDGCGSSSTK